MVARPPGNLSHTGQGDAKARRKVELAADRLGTQLACLAGYDVTIARVANREFKVRLKGAIY